MANLSPEVIVITEIKEFAVIETSGSVEVVSIKRETVEVVEVAVQGPQGAPGAGGAAVSFTHTQSVAAVEWVVNHNLGAYPLSEVRSNGGVVVDAEVLHVSTNQFKVFFETAYSGFVRCL